MEQNMNEMLGRAVDRLFNQVFQSQDLVNHIFEIVIKLKDREFTFYGVSEEHAETNAKDFLKEIILDKELFDTYVL
jgi:ABC-type arginine transport system ATPase subunit